MLGISFLFDLASDGVYQAIQVTLDAGELLPHRFTLTCVHRRFAFCCTFPSLSAGRRYRPSCPAKPGLSSPDLQGIANKAFDRQRPPS